ncbi:MAG: DUF1579 family protein [Bryobacteraceae bacterium]
MSSKSIAIAIAPLVFAAVAFAQGDQAPQRAPELKKLDYFVGTWKTEAEMKPGPFGPGGKVASTDHFEWQKGEFFVIGHSDFTSPMGGGVELSVMGYDPARKVFTYQSFNSVGEHESATGTVDGDTWSWASADQSPFKWRYTEKILSPTSFSVKFEGSQDGANWSTIMEGKVAKQ